MKILHIDTEKTWRGGEQQLLYLVKGLKERGHISTVVCQPGSPLENAVRNAGIEAVPVKMRSEFDLMAAWSIGSVLRGQAYDVLHTHTSHAHSIALLACLFGKAKVMVVHRRVDFPLKSLFKYNLLGVHYIAISEAIKRVMIEGGVAEDRIEVVRSCIDIESLEKAPVTDIRREFGIKSDFVLIGNIAHMADHKGQIYLIRAAYIVRKRYHDVRFIIVGDGELRGKLEEEVRRLGLSGTVIFTGFRKDVASFLTAFDIFAFPSHLEGLGTSLLDAMVMRKPIVSTTAGGISEIVEDGVNGILVPPRNPEAIADAIIRLIEDTNLRKTFGEAGRKVVEERFSVERMVEGNLTVYKALLSS